MHDPLLPAGPVPIAGADPVRRVRYQAARKWVAMDVAPLFDALLIGEDVEVVEPALPEWPCSELAGYRDLQRLQHNREVALRRLAHQQVDVLRHDDAGVHRETIPHTRGFETALKDPPRKMADDGEQDVVTK